MKKEDDVLQALQSKTSLKEGQKTIQYEESPRGSEWGVVDKVVKVFKGMREQLSPTIQKNVKVEVMEEGIDKEIVSIVHSVFVVISMDILFINVGAILTLMLKRK